MTSSKRKNKTYTMQFKEKIVALVTDQGYTVLETADAVGGRANQIYNWKQLNFYPKKIEHFTVLIIFKPGYRSRSDKSDATPTTHRLVQYLLCRKIHY